jgi:hypothetical protein
LDVSRVLAEIKWTIVEDGNEWLIGVHFLGLSERAVDFVSPVIVASIRPEVHHESASVDD